jgi:glycosyltransferase involved in cell wall biosynthesis
MATVVLIGINYAPERTGTAINNVDMAHSLRDAGHKVIVMTGMPHYPEWRVYERYRGQLRRDELVDEVRVMRFGHYVPTHQSAVTRGLYETTFLLNGALVTIRPRPDLFVGIIPSLSGGWLARFHAMQSRSIFGLVFADLMGKAAEQSGVPGAASVSAAVRTLEVSLARSAAGVGIIAEGFRGYLISAGVEEEKIHRIVNRNRASPDSPKVSRDDVRRRMGWSPTQFVVLHSGNMGYKQGLDNVLRAAALAARRTQLRFVLLGDGNQRLKLEGRARRLGLQNLDFLSLVPTEDFDSILAAADVLLVNQRGAVTDMSLPGKVTAYFAAGVPVLAAVAAQSETAKEVRRSGAGLVVSPDNPEELVAGVERLADDRETYARLAMAGQPYVHTYLKAASTSNITHFVEFLLASRRGPSIAPEA